MLGTTSNIKEITIDTLTMDIEGSVGDNLEYSSSVLAVCDFYGPSDFLNLRNPDNNLITLLLGENVSDNPALAQTASPGTYFPQDFRYFRQRNLHPHQRRI